MRTKSNTVPNLHKYVQVQLTLPSYITEHHLKLQLGFSKPFQVQSQLNTSQVNGNLVLQEAFKPSQLIPELILAVCLKHLRL